MAYREFHYEKQYAAPDHSQAYAMQAEGISNLFRGIRAKEEQRKTASAQFEFDLKGGSYENDTRLFTPAAMDITKRMGNAIRTGDIREQNKIRSEMVMWEGAKKQSENQLKQAEQLRELIIDRKAGDKYYDDTGDLDLLVDAQYANNRDFVTRGDAIEEAKKKMFGIKSFKFNEHRADYVADMGKKTQNQSGLTVNRSFSSPFINPLTGKPEVTDGHARDYLRQHNGDVGNFIQGEIDEDMLNNDVKFIKDSANLGDARTAWAKGMSDDEILLNLKKDMNGNPFSEKDKDGKAVTYAQKVINTAKAKLWEAAEISKDVDYNFEKEKKGDGTSVTNDNIRSDDNFYTTSIGGANELPGNIIDAFGMYVSGPGRTLLQKDGKDILMESSGQDVFELSTGEYSKRRGGAGKFNLNGVQYMIYDNSGRPAYARADTNQQLIDQVQSWPDSKFKNLDPELHFGLRGYSFGESKVLQGIKDNIYKAQDQLASAFEKGEDTSRIELHINKLNETLDKYTGQSFMTDDVAVGAGVKARRNQIIKASDDDISFIKSVTGVDFKNPKSKTYEMEQLEQVYKNKYNKAKANGFGTKKEESKQNSYLIGGYEYTEKELIDSGMDPDQISSELKSGRIKKKEYSVNQQKAVDAFVKQMNRQPSPTELNKLLDKYK